MTRQKDYSTLSEFSKLAIYDRRLTFFRIITMDAVTMQLWVQILTEKYKKMDVIIDGQKLLSEIETVVV